MSGLLLYYSDELQFISQKMILLNYPLPVGEKNIFADDNEDNWQDEEWKKKKKSVGGR